MSFCLPTQYEVLLRGDKLIIKHKITGKEETPVSLSEIQVLMAGITGTGAKVYYLTVLIK